MFFPIRWVWYMFYPFNRQRFIIEVPFALIILREFVSELEWVKDSGSTGNKDLSTGEIEYWQFRDE